jgi:hypothetical protein
MLIRVRECTGVKPGCKSEPTEHQNRKVMRRHDRDDEPCSIALILLLSYTSWPRDRERRRKGCYA